MFCYQCEETVNGKGCTKIGVCGKTEDVASLQDQLIYILKQISISDISDDKTDKFIIDSLFATITNANFNPEDFKKRITEGLDILSKNGKKITKEELNAIDIGVLGTKDEDRRSLRQIIIYGLKGIAAYAHHAYVLGFKDKEIFDFIKKALSATIDDRLTNDNLTAIVLETGKMGIKVMELLDRANTSTYGNPEPTNVNIGVRNKPGILISGHDLKDMKELLEQTKDSGIDIYTHSEMLPANYYPKLKAYKHFVGNYGGSWWMQKEEFENFNGPILLTSNCLVPPKESYKKRIYTTGTVSFEGCTYIEEKNGKKDFSVMINHAKKCSPPKQIETGIIKGGFAHNYVLSIADKLLDAIKAGKIKRFIVMSGCDGRHKERDYYTGFAKALPKDTIILTSGCAKYRYNKLDLGDIDGIPRVLDAGQCNDSYSWIVVASKLAEVLKVDINELPISFNIAWYEQKAVLILLSLLSLGIKDITLGPKLPAFVSPNVLKVLVEKFNIRPNTTIEQDMPLLLG